MLKRILIAAALLLAPAAALAQQYILSPSNIQNVTPGGTTTVESVVQSREARYNAANLALGAMSKGTVQYGPTVVSGTVNQNNNRYLKLDQATYNALIALNANTFATDTVSGSITSETAETWGCAASNWVCPFNPVDGWNDGLRKQVVVMIGDSITASVTGSTQYNGLNDIWNQVWAQPVIGQFVSPNANSWGGYYDPTHGYASSPLLATMGGSASAGDTGSLIFTSPALSGSPITISYTVQNGDTLSSVCSGFVTNIAANATLAAAGVAGSCNGAVLSLTFPIPPAFTPAIAFTKTNGSSLTITYAAPAAVNPGGTYKSVTYSGNSLDFAYTRAVVGKRTRVVFNLGKGGWYFYNLAGVSSVNCSTTGAWVDNGTLYSVITAAHSQQLVFRIELGTNDFHCLGSLYPGKIIYGSPLDGSPDIVTNGLTPMITDILSKYPRNTYNTKIVVQTPHARDEGSCCTALSNFENQETVNYASYLQANKVALGIDAIIDARTMCSGALSPGSWVANTANTFLVNGATAYYNDGVHLTPYAYTTCYGPAETAALDGLLP